MLFVDDLQWVDERSLALCHYLVRAARDHDQPLTVFAAARSAGGGREFLGWLQQQGYWLQGYLAPKMIDVDRPQDMPVAEQFVREMERGSAS